MQSTFSGISRHPSHKGEARAVGALWRFALAIGIATVAIIGVNATSASAADTPSPTQTPPAPPAPTPTPTPTPSRQVADRTTIVATPSDFSPTGFASIGGSRLEDSAVVVTSGGATICSVPASTSTIWSCGSVAVPDGADVELTATETRARPGDPAPAPATTTIDVLRAPVLDGTGSFVTTGLVSGTGRPGSVVTVSVDGNPDGSCASVPVSENTYWSCNLGKPSGRFIVRAQQSDPTIANGSLSAYSNAQDVSVDRDAPASAVITSPAAETRISDTTAAVTGTGEDRAAVDVYLDNVPTCSTTVAGGTWSCTVGGFGRGSHTLQAVLRDVAGNYASPSGVVRFTVVAAASTAPSPVPTPVHPTDPGSPGAAPPPAPAPPPVQDDGSDPPPAAPVPIPTEAFSNWGAPTGFGIGLTSFSDTFTLDDWYTGPLIGLVFLALVALPLRLLATTLGGRLTVSRRRFTGRNRPELRRRADADTPASPWITVVMPLAVTAALIAVSVGVDGEVRYLRLYLAIGIGLAILNLVGGAVVTRVASRWAGVEERLRFLPIMLIAAVVTAMASRFAGLEPPMITGVLIGTGFALGVPVRQRAMVGLAQVGTVTALGLAAWSLFETMSPGSGFLPAVASEALATVCLAGLGSALILVLPIASLPGRVILEWSRPAWAIVTIVVSTAVAWVVFGSAAQLVALAPWVLAAAAFAAISVAVWTYVRFVEPQTQN